MKKLLLLLLLLPGILVAQKKSPHKSALISAACNAYGTVPDKAIPVCGTKSFFQDKITSCTGPNISPTECAGDPFPSSDSYWYKFKCFTAGSLGFLLTPRPLTPPVTTDFDFILFDVTGHNPNDVFTDHSLVVTLNGVPPNPTGITGCSPFGVLANVCYSNPITDSLNKMPNLIAGHNYLLMVTNYSTNTAGYDLVFIGGTAVISDGVPPAIDHVDGGCSKVNVVFTTDIKCTSVTASGSEFT
ncbi:MAG: hypothetical protein ACKOU7_06385, partial [Ferruginibacter sp.]